MSGHSEDYSSLTETSVLSFVLSVLALLHHIVWWPLNTAVVQASSLMSLQLSQNTHSSLGIRPSLVVHTGSFPWLKHSKNVCNQHATTCIFLFFLILYANVIFIYINISYVFLSVHRSFNHQIVVWVFFCCIHVYICVCTWWHLLVCVHIPVQ